MHDDERPTISSPYARTLGSRGVICLPMRTFKTCVYVCTGTLVVPFVRVRRPLCAAHLVEMLLDNSLVLRNNTAIALSRKLYNKLWRGVFVHILSIIRVNENYARCGAGGHH